MSHPGKYFHNNIQGSVNLLEAMSKAGVQSLVFSSTCAVYGTPENVPVTENESYKPESIYGASKHLAEQVMAWYEQSKGIKFTPLRYFNASGSSFDARIGDAYKPASRLIPILMEFLLGQRERFFVNGDDYPTPDGTAIRDYIHVDDLATAHIAALNYLWQGGESMPFNLGTGTGTSVLEIINMVRDVSGLDFEIEMGPRRAGDPVRIWADNSRARDILGWQPQYGLREIIETDWQWHSSHPHGFE
jgi:UDP-glucose 4-epimerase